MSQTSNAIHIQPTAIVANLHASVFGWEKLLKTMTKQRE